MTEMLQKTENVANENSQDLTSQWKKGELPEGWYYGKIGNNNYILSTWKGVKNYIQLKNKDGEVFIREMDDCEVLAEVPDYVEYEQLKEYEQIVTSYNMKPIDYEIACETVNKLLDEKKALKEQNAQLKELLKECSPYISRSATSRMIKNSAGHKKNMKLLTKIDEVLK